MNIWLISVDGETNIYYGWFKSERECRERCDKLNNLYNSDNFKFKPQMVASANQ